MKFKVGDRMVNTGDRHVCEKCARFRGSNAGKHGEVAIVNPFDPEERYYHIKYDDGSTGQGGDCAYELENKKTIMQKVSLMMKKLLSKDIQTLVKAGYINGDLDLTERGKDVLLAQLFESNRAELVKSAEEELAEEENNF